MTSPRILADRLIEKTFGKPKAAPAEKVPDAPQKVQSVALRLQAAREARQRTLQTRSKVRNL